VPISGSHRSPQNLCRDGIISRHNFPAFYYATHLFPNQLEEIIFLSLAACSAGTLCSIGIGCSQYWANPVKFYLQIRVDQRNAWGDDPANLSGFPTELANGGDGSNSNRYILSHLWASL
jgi:hypothetical protein